MRNAGLWTASISTFADRHSAFHWCAGFNEVINLGTDGRETADQVSAAALDWLRRRGRDDGWFLHVHFWDPHIPYRTPPSAGNPLSGSPYPSWIDGDVLRRHWQLAGPHSAQELLGFEPDARFADFPLQPEQVASETDLHALFDGYDLGIRYADEHIGRLLECLDDLGLGDETAVLVSSDHGENLGELGIYCDHQTADLITHRVPAILRWPGLGSGVVDKGLRYHVDLAATIADLAGAPPPPTWDGTSFATELGAGSEGRTEHPGRDYLVLSCAAWTVQRSVRFDRWLYLRTYHDAFHGFPDAMLFDVETDPHEQHDVAADRPEIVGHGAALLLDWETSAMRRSAVGQDPLWNVMGEGGGYYIRGRLESYLARLAATGREDSARRIAAKANLT
jgi:arylsulfatase A-like enzyme